MKEQHPAATSSASEDALTRIQTLRRKLQQLAGGPLIEGAHPDCPPDLREQFLQRVLDYEQMPRTSLHAILTERGVDLRDPRSLADTELTVRLWDLIHALASVRIFLECTDHLNDRELYGYIWKKVLPVEDVYFPSDPAYACHFDPIGSGSEADTHLYLKHYADEIWRENWAEEFPGDPIPPHEQPPYDRDRHLPRP